jgi:protein CpxP
MNVRKFLLCAVALGAMASTSLLKAQDEKKGKGGRGGGTPEQQVARLDEAVTLTAEQKTKVTAIYAKYQEKLQAIPQEERQEKGREIMQARRDEVRALLTDEQKKKFDEMPQGGRGGGKKKN